MVPFDASLSFKGNDIIYTVPGVGSDEFAEARIVFPASWLSDAPTSNKKVLSTVLDEEQKWADEANERRAQARMVSYAALGIGVLVALLAGTVSLGRLSSYRKRHTPQFDDKYFRDVPTDDHPAVLGALLNDDEPTDDDMSAALVRLTDIGALKLEKVAIESRGVFGRKKSEDDYALTKVDNAGVCRRARARPQSIDRPSSSSTRCSQVQGPRERRPVLLGLREGGERQTRGIQRRIRELEDRRQGPGRAAGFFVDRNSNGQGLVVGAVMLDILRRQPCCS